MSVRFNGSGRYLRRTASLPNEQLFSICGWAKLTVRSSQYQYFASMENATSSSSQYFVIGFNSSGGFEISSSNASAAFASAPSTEAWFFFALTQTTYSGGGNSLKGYWASPGDTTFVSATCDGAAFVQAVMYIGNDSYDEWCNIAMANIKIWDAVLTSAELLNEMYSARPVNTTSLHVWSPLFSTGDETDYSGTGRNWTSAGTLSSEESPPIEWAAPPVLYPYATATAAVKFRRSLTPRVGSRGAQ